MQFEGNKTIAHKICIKNTLTCCKFRQNECVECWFIEYSLAVYLKPDK